MRVLVACEFSGIVRDAFIARGHDAWSCDLLPSEKAGPHFTDDIFHVLAKPLWVWDLLIAFPPCTYLAASGARWFKDRLRQQQEAIECVTALWSANIPRIAIENPIGVLSTKFRKPSQIVQPWQFGHGETKATCLWLKNLAPLLPTSIAIERHGRVWREPPSPERWKNRSRTYSGIADAMANQWGSA